MTSMLVYLLLGTASTVAFAAVYVGLFRRRPAVEEQRRFLLTAVVVSMVVPLLSLLPSWNMRQLWPQSLSSAVAEAASDTLGADTGQGSSALASLWHRLLWAIGVVYGLGLALHVALALRRVGALRRRLSTLPSFRQGRIRCHRNPDDALSFSVGRHLVVGTRGLTPTEQCMVVLHEAAHIRRGHSRDLRLMQVAETLYWFNPLLRRCTAELKRLHDLEADRDTLADVGREAYAHLLCHAACGCPGAPFPTQYANQFVSTSLAQRIESLYRPWQRRPAALLWLLPLVLLVAATAACGPAKGQAAEQEACEHESVQATAPTTSEPTADNAHEAEPKPASAAGHHAEQAETTVVVKHPTTPSEVTIDGSTQELHHKDISFQFTVTHSETGRPATEEEKSSISPHLTKLLSSLVGSSADTTQP